ncbi:MAG: DUF1553 domain-containing protein [Pirellulaceae bacterium]|nr:DUF1553 domain-containing protein [Pirellulaceae bacterium]
MVDNSQSKRTWLVLIGMVASVTGSAATLQAVVPEKISFNAHVRPILSDKCFACHGFDAKQRQADLRLDIAEGAQAERDGKFPVVAGDLSKSQVWQRIIATKPDEIMPPADSHKSLNDEEKQVIRRWIEQGAPYQKHWAFEAVTEVTPPTLGPSASDAEALSNPIDAFIQARLVSQGLGLAPEASQEILIRRAAFALTGLPPTIAQVDAYLADKSDDAYERMVERFMDSQHYGEEMARHWLDVARYADTHGMHLDNERQTWAYRDWVIEAFNRNLSFDQFTIEQLAGDLLPEPTLAQLTATGFNRCNVTTSEGGSIGEELLYRYAVDRASTTMQTWLGLTGGCAVCHDHKFDPITQKEFYSFYAFFNSAADPAMDGNALLTQPVMKLTKPDAQQQMAELDKQISARQQEIDAEAAKVAYVDPADKPESEQVMTVTEHVWMEDDFPAGGKLHAAPGAPPQFVKADEGNPVYSGERSLKRTDAGLAQDVWEQAKTPLVIPAAGKVFAFVWLDPANSPRSIMIQFFKSGWDHRAVWGDYKAIDWGAAGTTERVDMGPLPEAGKWVRLEVPVEKVGLAAGDELKGFALTQFGGTVWWDHVGVSGSSNPAIDPKESFLAWWKSVAGKDTPSLPADLKSVAKDGPAKKADDKQADDKKADDKKPDEKLVKRLREYYLQEICNSTKAQFAGLIKDRNALSEQRKAIDDAIPSTFIFKDLPKPRDSFVMMRGAYDKPGDAVQPDVLSVLPPLEKSDPMARASRLDLARWLVSDKNPLTARVTVNRFWQQFYGTGLVKTSYDFGSQGDMPSHPELLDWLARDFQQSGWNVKRLVRLLVSSRTFKQRSQITPELYQLDPENRLYARGPRFRLDAEQIRDNALYVSGLINLEMGGKGVKPYQPDNIWEPVGFGGSNTRNYKRDSGPALYRRSIYNFFKRTAPPPFMVNFDAPNREQFCTKREKSNTPLQALQLMNDVQHVEAARALAQLMLEHGGDAAAERLTFAYRTILSRSPMDAELAVLQTQLDKNLAHYGSDVELAKKLIAQGESKPKAELDASELAAYTLIANTILNLDETVTRN